MEQDEILILFSLFYCYINHPYYSLIHVIFEFLYPIYLELYDVMPRSHDHRELEVHEPNSSSPLVITSSRRQWNAVSPLVNS